MESARCLIQVQAGVIPEQPMDEYGKTWAITSAEWYDKGHERTQGEYQMSLLEGRNRLALDYAAQLMSRPDWVNWVRTDWIWL